jgi:hypothetical protein
MLRKFCMFCLLIVFSLTFFSTGLAQNDVNTVFSDCIEYNTANLTVVSRAMVGEATCIEAAGDYAYLGAENAFMIFDVSEPQEPVLLYQEFTCDAVMDIAVSGDYAYVLCRDLLVYDISNPPNPVKVNKLTGATSIFSHGYDSAQKIEISNGFLYIVGGFAEDYYTTGLCILDISNPTEPRQIGNFHRVVEMDGWKARDVCLVGNLAYLTFSSDEGADSGGGWAFWILDVSDKADPKPLSYYNPGDDIFSVKIYKNYAFVGGDRGIGLLILDVSNPASPQLLQQVPTYWMSFNLSGMVIQDSLLYLSAFDSLQTGLKVFDISSPDALRLITAFPEHINQIKITNNTMYAAKGYGGLQIFDISQPASPKTLGGFRTDGDIKNVWVYNDYAYVWAYGLSILDISDKQHPERAARFFPSPTTIHDLVVKDNVLFIAGSKPYGFSTYDISNLADIKLIDFLQVGEKGVGGRYVTKMAGGQAVALLDTALLVFDISDPANLHQTGKFDFIKCNDAALANGYAALAYKNRLKLLDISDPQNIQETSDFSANNGNTFDLYIVENYLYYFSKINSLEYYLNIVDVSDISNPVLLNLYPMMYCNFCYRRDNKYFDTNFMYGTEMQLEIFDISTPDSIQKNGVFKLRNHWSWHVCAKDGYIYLPNTGGSLYILKFDPDTQVETQQQDLSVSFQLSQNYPNPVNAGTIISYQINLKDHVKLSIYDLMGREVITLVNDEKQPGSHRISWNGKDRHGNLIPSGVYFYQLQTAETQQSRKMIILR